MEEMVEMAEMVEFQLAMFIATLTCIAASLRNGW